jgi:glutaredoxin
MKKQTLAEYLLFSLCIISTADTVVIFAADHNLIGHRNARAVPIINSSTPLPPISGYSEGGRTVHVGSSSRTGYVVRYTSAHCPYCQRDESAWSELAHVFKIRGFSVVELVPRSTDADSPESGPSRDSQEISFVSTEWLNRVRLNVTPSIVAVSGNGSVLWSHTGILSYGDNVVATRAVTQGTK